MILHFLINLCVAIHRTLLIILITTNMTIKCVDAKRDGYANLKER